MSDTDNGVCSDERDDHCDMPEDGEEFCEMCDSPINQAFGDYLECSMCHCPGCPACLMDWDDVFPNLCADCVAALTGKEVADA